MLCPTSTAISTNRFEYPHSLSYQARILTIFANLGGVIVGICVAYALGRILQIFIGQEIVMNQEIIIEEEITLSDYKKAMAEEAAKEKKKRRQKKAKNS